jgi:hypothetical protein
MANPKSVFETLNSVPFRDKIENKGGLDYLSWAWAWSMLKANYPNANRIVYEDPATGLNFFTDGKTAYVKVGISIDGLEHIDYLPIMDFRNNPILIDKLTATDVNKTIQRSTAKAIAMHGLGIQLWSGEDIPGEAPATSPAMGTPKQSASVQPTPQPQQAESLKTGTENWDRVVAYVTANKEIGFDKIIAQLKRKYTIAPSVANKIKELL